VADARAATPTAGAEILTENAFASRDFVATAPGRLLLLLRRRLEEERDNWQRLARAIERSHPRRKLDEHWQYLDDLRLRLARKTRQSWREHLARWELWRKRLNQIRWHQELARRRQLLKEQDRRRQALARARLAEALSRWQTAQARLELLSPTRVLERGFSITLDARTGQILRRALDATPGQLLLTRLPQGTIGSVVESVSKPAPTG